MKNYPYLQDSDFLQKFDLIKLKEQYAKIIVLSWDEKPIQAIQGQVTGGTITLDGTSSIRRTCNLSMIASDFENDLTNVNNLFSINKKVDVEIGFLNNSGEYQEYEIIWFPVGVYVMINPSLSHGTGGVTISMQLKDKMCLLNGDCGGIIPASTTFHEYDTIDENGKYIIVKPTIVQIITELVNHFGGEQLSKIIVSDIDTRIKQVMKWTGSSPLYIIQETKGGAIQYTPTTDFTTINSRKYNLYQSGDDIGYIYTDFTYPEELIGDAGATVTSILDKIKETLGNYEYFYDLDGNFVFQEIKNYLNTSQSTVELEKLSNSDYLIDNSKGKAVYVFDDSNLITSYSNTPQFSMIKNDFIVWGIKTGADGIDLPIRYHLAIDQKPATGNTYEVFFYTDPDDNITKAKCPTDFKTKSVFPLVGTEGIFYRDLSTDIIYKWDSTDKVYVALTIGLQKVTTTDWRTELYLQGSASEPLGTDSNYYYTELANEWPKQYDVQNGKFYDESIKYPNNLDFYLDFIDSNAAVSELSVSNIGRRTKVISDDSINCVFEPDIPDLILLSTADENLATLRAECEAKGQDYIQLDSNMYSLITGGGTSNSAYNMVRELLYQYTSYNENVTLNAIPIYYLEPNTRITIRDTQSGIYGDYMINSISIPLDINSTMSISCTRALERI